MASIIRNRGRSEPTATRLVQPVAFNFEDMNDRANEYLETVRSEAAKIVQQAHQQAEQIRRQAQSGAKQAAEEATQKMLDDRLGVRLNTLLPALQQLVTDLNDTKAEWLRRWERSAVSVAAAIAERVLRRELAQQPEISLEWIAEALRLAAGAADITLHLNPVDHQHLGAQVESLAQSLGKIAPSNIIADPEISAGGCRLTTRYGEIDQQIEAQLKRIEEELG